MNTCNANQMNSAWSLGVSALALALCLPACGSSEDGPGAAGSAGTASDAPATQDVGAILPSPSPCTEPNTICMNMQVPSTMQGQPTRLLFDVFDTAEVPNHLPNGYAGFFTSPSLTAGEQLYFELTDGGLQGDYWMWVVLYMEGGGYGAPVNGVDYVMSSKPAALHLDGTPLNIAEPVVLSL